jgi:hypothetical protein
MEKNRQKSVESTSIPLACAWVQTAQTRLLEQHRNLYLFKSMAHHLCTFHRSDLCPLFYMSVFGCFGDRERIPSETLCEICEKVWNRFTGWALAGEAMPLHIFANIPLTCEHQNMTINIIYILYIYYIYILYIYNIMYQNKQTKLSLLIPKKIVLIERHVPVTCSLTVVLRCYHYQHNM